MPPTRPSGAKARLGCIAAGRCRTCGKATAPRPGPRSTKASRRTGTNARSARRCGMRRRSSAPASASNRRAGRCCCCRPPTTARGHRATTRAWRLPGWPRRATRTRSSTTTSPAPATPSSSPMCRPRSWSMHTRSLAASAPAAVNRAPMLGLTCNPGPPCAASWPRRWLRAAAPFPHHGVSQPWHPLPSTMSSIGPPAWTTAAPPTRCAMRATRSPSPRRAAMTPCSTQPCPA